MIATGKLKHKVWVYKQVQSTEANGTVSIDWEKAEVMRAAIEPMSGRELEIAKSQGSECSTKITIRFWKYLTTAHRLITNFGDIYEIGSIVNKSFDNVFLELQCKRLDERKRALVLRDAELNMILDEDGDPMLVVME